MGHAHLLVPPAGSTCCLMQAAPSTSFSSAGIPISHNTPRGVGEQWMAAAAASRAYAPGWGGLTYDPPPPSNWWQSAVYGPSRPPCAAGGPTCPGCWGCCAGILAHPPAFLAAALAAAAAEGGGGHLAFMPVAEIGGIAAWNEASQQTAMGSSDSSDDGMGLSVAARLSCSPRHSPTVVRRTKPHPSRRLPPVQEAEEQEAIGPFTPPAAVEPTASVAVEVARVSPRPGAAAAAEAAVDDAAAMVAVFTSLLGGSTAADGTDRRARRKAHALQQLPGRVVGWAGSVMLA